MNESNDTAANLADDAATSDYLREVEITVENLINTKILSKPLTLSQFNLSSGEWVKPAPEQGQEIKYAGNPGQWSAKNATYPGEVRGFMVFTVQDEGKLRLEFHSSLNDSGATINGEKHFCVVEGFYFTLESSARPGTDQPHYRVQATQYKP